MLVFSAATCYNIAMCELKETIAKNLVDLRKQSKLTQLQLAELLNYSDKAVSKWERGEAIPDIRVLIQLSEIYGVTVDDLLKGEGVAVENKPHKSLSSKHAFITVLSVIFVWFVATGIFATLYFIPATGRYAYLVFAVAPLPTGIVLNVFSVKWGNRVTHALSSSLILWACVEIIHVYVWTFHPEYKRIFVLYIVAAVFEILIILWFVYRRYASHKR